MMRPVLRVTLCLAALACACPCLLAQASSATGGNAAPDFAARAPGVTLSATYAAARSLASEIAAILADPRVARDHWGIQVTALDGMPIYSLNEGQLFQPASNAKLFTTSAALALLGPDATVETSVSGTPDGVGGVILGDLVIKGTGDANLSGRELPSGSTAPAPPPLATRPLRYLEELADQVVAAGVKTVTGDIVGDDTAFPWEPYPIGWNEDDTLWGYGAPVSALSIIDNQLRLTVASTPYVGGALPSVTLNQNGVPYYSIDGKVKGVTAGGPYSNNLPDGPQRYTGSTTEIGVEREAGSRTLRIYGQIVDGGPPDTEQIAIADPAEYAAMAFRQILEQHGIAVHGVARARHQLDVSPRSFLDIVRGPETCNDLYALHPCMASCTTLDSPDTVLAEHLSAPLAQDVILTNKVSENLHAELMLHRLGERLGLCGGPGSTAAGARMVSRFLIHLGIDANDFIFYDGSGLSTHDLVTPRATAKLLSYAAHDPKTGQPQTWFPLWKSSLPVGGEDGTLASRFGKAPLKDHLFAKTGTLGEARALSGYLDAASGRTVIFSIFVGDHLPGTSDDRDAMDKIVAAIQAAE